MKSYEKTLWENNKTVVDAEKLNNVENQIQALTLTTVKNNDRLQIMEDTLPMKANAEHTHPDLHNDLIALQEELEEIKSELGLELGKYFDDVTLEGDILNFYSNEILIKSIKLPAVSSGEAVRAICGEALCGEVVSGQGLEHFDLRTSDDEVSYNPTVWRDGFTPINAENLNKIEGKILELVSVVNSILANGGSVESNIHIGDTEPVNKDVLWIDNSDEEPELQLDESIIEAFANVLKEHSSQIQELFYLSDAYLDDGDFTDTEESDYILEGGIF